MRNDFSRFTTNFPTLSSSCCLETLQTISQRTAVLQHRLLFFLGKLLVRRHLPALSAITFNNTSSDFCFVSLPTMLSSFSPKVFASAGLPFPSAPWQWAQFFS